jgi:hypothetical protein
MGRLGCSLVHDHPGSIVDASHILAVGPCPTASTASTSACSSSCTLVPIVLYVHLVYDWMKARPGKLVGTVALMYGPYRFFLDTMREKDKLYMGLTTAHYASMLILAFGVYLVFFRKPKPETSPGPRTAIASPPSRRPGQRRLAHFAQSFVSSAPVPRAGVLEGQGPGTCQSLPVGWGPACSTGGLAGSNDRTPLFDAAPVDCNDGQCQTSCPGASAGRGGLLRARASVSLSRAWSARKIPHVPPCPNG